MIQVDWQCIEMVPSGLLKGENPRLIEEWQGVPTLWDTMPIGCLKN